MRTRSRRRTGRPVRRRRGRSLLLAALLPTLALLPAVARAGDPNGGGLSWLRGRCADPPAAAPGPAAYAGGSSGLDRLGTALLRHDDLANGTVYLLATGALALAADPPRSPRWTGGILFDGDARDGLRIDTRDGRDAARTASDVLLGLTLGAPLLFDAAVKSWLHDGDCERASAIASDWWESFWLTALLTEATKVAVGRERPYANACEVDSGYDPDCGKKEERMSFFSGHASWSAMGAGLLCADALRRETWGPGPWAKALPCGLGVGASLATGLLRVASDQHWLTDVVVGWTVGALVGAFDLPGPFDLLRFRYRGRGVATEGLVLPVPYPGGAGLHLVMRF